MQANWKRNVALFLASQAISHFGSALVQLAITWYITLTTQPGAARCNVPARRPPRPRADADRPGRPCARVDGRQPTGSLTWVEWMWMRALGSMYRFACATAVATSPNPLAISFNLPG